MDESNRSEFLLIADALGAYMVQAMHGQTESEQLDTLSKDPFFRKVCEPVHRFYRNLTNDAIISVYDESNDWTDCLLHDYIYNLYDRFSEGIDYWEEGNEGVLGYVRYRILSPLADDLIRELSQEKLRVDLYPGFDKARAYFDFLVPYTSHAKKMLIHIGVKEDDDCPDDITNAENIGVDPLSHVESLSYRGTQLTALERIYCLLDGCYEAVRRYQNYEVLVSIVDTLEAAIGEVDIESPDSWQAEYVQRVSRLSKWYRMLGHAFTGNNAYRNLLEELIAAQEQTPLVHEPYFNNYICDVSCQDNVFNLECLQYLLLHHDIVYFLVLLKSIHRFYLDQLDRNLWNELLRLWSMYGKRNFQDYYAECLCAKYMAVLAMYMGDREVAERIKQDLHTSFERARHWHEPVPSEYSWSTFAFYTMAQIDEALGNLDSAQDNYDKAYVTHAYTQAGWSYYESKCNSLWNGTQSSMTETKLTAASSQPAVVVTKPDFETVIKENKGKFSTIGEYKEFFHTHMMYLYM